jgi:predicted RecA/RadA family phage recombinase
MSKNVRFDPASVLPLSFSSSASIAGGGGVLVGNIFGVVENDMASTSAAVDVPVRIHGVVQINKTGSLAVAVGDVLYWDDTGKVVNKTNTTKEVGQAWSSTGSGAGETTVNVMLVPSLRNATNS